MTPTNPARTDGRNGRLTNFTEYFKEPHDVWVRTTTAKQVSLNMPTGPGQTTSFVVVATGDPFNLTIRFDFETIRKSPDIRQFVAGRKDPLLQLMTAVEATAYYDRKAKRDGFDSPEEAMTKAEEKREKMLSVQNDSSTTARPVNQDHASPNGDNVVSIEQVITPRVIHLCHQVDDSIPINQRWDAGRLLDELEQIESSMTADDFQYVVGHGRYKSIIRWADTRMKAKLQGATADQGSAILEDNIPEDRIALH